MQTLKGIATDDINDLKRQLGLGHGEYTITFSYKGKIMSLANCAAKRIPGRYCENGHYLTGQEMIKSLRNSDFEVTVIEEL